MDKTFNISVRDRLAKNLSHLDYVCGNTGYMVRFDFDEEWDAYPIKIARFIESSGEHHDVAVIDNQCEFPQIMNTIRVEVGVYAGDLYTTTPAVIGARRSILSTGGDRPAVPEENEYDKMMEAINQDAVRAENAADEAEKAAEEAKKAAEKAVGGGIVVVQITRENGVMKSSHTFRELQDLREKKVLLAMEGARTYTYFGQEEMNLVFANVDYSGGQNNKSLHARRLVISSDDTVAVYSHNNVKVPNPNRLKITGAVSAEYDGSSPVTVNIPEGGEGGGTGLPTAGEPHQMLVTDADGVAKWEERTHYSETEQAIVFPETTPVAMGDGQFAIMEPVVNHPTAGNMYTVRASDTESYELEAFAFDMEGMTLVGIGNPLFVGGENNELAFLIAFFPADVVESMGGIGAVVMTQGADNLPKISVSGTVEKVHKIDKKYLPNIGASWLVNGSNVGSVRNLNASEEDETYKMGVGAVAMGGQARGIGSFSVGDGAVANGDYSFAHHGTATGTGSFTANGARAEGSYSFAANAGIASGHNSAAFGSFNEAKGNCSFAVGNNTLAAGKDQHVQGRYNLEDTANKYAHIVGNGIGTKRSNAHTIDWDGNAWFAGTVEGTALILPDTVTGKRYKITVADGKLTMEEVQ